MVPLQPPRTFEQMTKYRSVSMGLPGPIMVSHQPGLRSSGLLSPAAWALPLSAWQIKMALSRCSFKRAVGFVSDVNGTEALAAFQVQRVGRVTTRTVRVLTIPTDFCVFACIGASCISVRDRDATALIRPVRRFSARSFPAVKNQFALPAAGPRFAGAVFQDPDSAQCEIILCRVIGANAPESVQ